MENKQDWFILVGNVHQATKTTLGHLGWLTYSVEGAGSMAISRTDLLEVPTIYKAYVRPM